MPLIFIIDKDFRGFKVFRVIREQTLNFNPLNVTHYTLNITHHTIPHLNQQPTGIVIKTCFN